MQKKGPQSRRESGKSGFRGSIFPCFSDCSPFVLFFPKNKDSYVSPMFFLCLSNFVPLANWLELAQQSDITLRQQQQAKCPTMQPMITRQTKISVAIGRKQGALHRPARCCHHRHRSGESCACPELCKKQYVYIIITIIIIIIC